MIRHTGFTGHFSAYTCKGGQPKYITLLMDYVHQRTSTETGRQYAESGLLKRNGRARSAYADVEQAWQKVQDAEAAMPGSKAPWPLQEETTEAVKKAIREAEALEATARKIARGGPLTFAQPLNLDSAAAATAPVLQQKKQQHSAGGASARMSRQRGRGAAAHVEDEADPPVKTEVKTEDPVKAEEAKQSIPSWPQMLTEEMRKRSSVVAGTSSDDLPPQADEAKPDEAEQQPDAEADEAEPAAVVVIEAAKPYDVKRSARLAAARKPR